MAWYRAGGGGIPSSLKTGMNSVLNKKFGTSTTYDPAGWPDDVNLLGKLPEKTASGSIAHITDGADRVPIKSWEVGIAPTLTGKSAIECTKTGKNVVNVTFSNYNASNIISNAFSLKAGTYTLSLNYIGTPTWGIYLRDGSAINSPVLFSKYNDTSLTFTLSEDKATLCFTMYYANGISSSEVSDVQLEVGSTATSYEPYTAPTVSTVNLGRTIYGGEVDIVNGEGQETHNYIDMGNLSWTYHAPSGNLSAYFDTYLPNDAKLGNSQTAFDGYTADYTSIKSTQIALSGYDDMVMALGHGSRHFFLCDQRYSDASALTTALTGKILVYPLATPTDFTFTPITPTPETALGVNNFWSDSGDTEVTYRADIDLALGGN